MSNLILWYLLLTVIGLVTMPIAYSVFYKLPDRGYSLSRILGMLIWGFLYWFLASLQLLQNNAGGMIFALVLLFGASWWFLKKTGWREVVDFLRRKKALWVTGELVFVVFFVVMALMRAVHPDISGTEKPMELAFINAILRSPNFPPNDPWLSGYSISYYYFGYVQVAMLSRMTGVASAISFNLALSAWFGMIALAAYGLLSNFLQIGSGYLTNKSGMTTREIPFVSLLAPVFILVLSNLEGFLEILHARGLFWVQSSDGAWQSRFWSWLNVAELNQPPAPPLNWVPERLGGIWWWRASRVLQDFDALGNSKEIIDEFPFFSFLLGDLHPHVLSMPFVFLSIGLALNLYLSTDNSLFAGMSFWNWIEQRLRQKQVPEEKPGLVLWMSSPDFWITALTLGGLAFLNTWDFPIYVALVSAVYALRRSFVLGWSLLRGWDFVEMGGVLGISGIILYLPFYLGFDSQAGGLLPSLGFFTRGIYFWIMFGPFLLPICLWLLTYVRHHGNRRYLVQGVIVSASLILGLFTISYLAGWLGLRTSLGGLLAGLQGGSEPKILLLGSIARRLVEPGTWITLLGMISLTVGGLFSMLLPVRNRNVEEENPDKKTTAPDSPDAFVMLLVLIGCGLALFPEFLYLRDQFGWRMNTIFKFYYQIWVLWGLAGSYALIRTWTHARGVGQALIKIGLTLVILMGLVYPFFGFYMKFKGVRLSDLNLDGSAYLARYNPEDMAAIRWLQTAPLGTVAEAVGGSYSGFARAATFSGLPNVLGWPGHESQWRGGAEEMGSREEDIRRLYETSNWAEAETIINQYQIRYILVGSLERNVYRVNEVKFDNRMRIAFREGSVLIYEVPAFSLVGSDD